MSVPRFVLVVAATAALFLAPLRQGRSESPDAAKAEPKLSDLHRGMPAAEVLKLLGQPSYIARQVLYGRYVEQWTYDAPFPVRLTFDWRKGQEKQIQTVQPLSRVGR